MSATSPSLAERNGTFWVSRGPSRSDAGWFRRKVPTLPADMLPFISCCSWYDQPSIVWRWRWDLCCVYKCWGWRIGDVLGIENGHIFGETSAKVDSFTFYALVNHDIHQIGKQEALINAYRVFLTNCKSRAKLYICHACYKSYFFVLSHSTCIEQYDYDENN